ncbi:SNF2 family N-terminal domain-containing protein [Cerioporus squamosus]|nr:SNF2 family N-terminal domain-containing protein [Cerioporus squamosus]
MLAEESDHTECLRLRPEWFSDNQEGQPRLSCAKILALLRERTGFDTASGKGKTTSAVTKQSKTSVASNKRRHDSDSEGGARKRVKVSVDDAISISDTEEERLFHAYQRVFRIRYTTATTGYPSCVSDEDAQALGWVEHENALREWLTAYAATVEDSHVVDMGLVSVDDFSWPPMYVRDRDDHSQIIGKLPDLRHAFLLEDYDISQRGRPLHDPLQAFQILANGGRARMDVHLYLVLSTAQSPDLMPFFLRVHVDCSFVCPKIFEPVAAASKASENTRVAEVQEAQRRLFVHLFPPQSPVSDPFRGHTDIPFLFSILRPAPALPSPAAYDALQPEELQPTLLPFQRRTVAWMMEREGKIVTPNGDIIPVSDMDLASRPLPLFWDAFAVSTEETWYVNRLRGVITPSRPTGHDDEWDEDAPGGIVAEEPGLGKTLECISTIMMNPAPDRSPVNKRWDPEAQIDVKEIKTTLIVTPPSLAPQWADELAAHAPGLKVLVYEGWQKVPVPISERDVAIEREKRQKQKAKPRAKSKKPARATKGKRKALADDDDDMDVDEDDEESTQAGDEDEKEQPILDWCAYVNTHDVCITTYNVLQQDLGVARPPPTRPRRAFVKYSTVHRSRSPLVMCEWYRVIMDEVQMVGGGKTEEMVSLIPRLSSFAVSGTPARSQVADLIHVLKFLRVSSVIDVPRAWLRLQLPGYMHEFTELFRRYAVRTMKAAVKDELTIPPQTRYLVPIELGRVERHVYDQTLDAALLDLGLDARGVAATENWEADVAKLRYWLRRLRGLCTHPQVGQLAVNAVDKLHKPGVLKSMAEVLDAMREQNWRNYMDDRKNRVAIMTTLAQLIQQEDGNRNRYRQALDLLIEGEQEADKLVADLKEALAEHVKEGERLKAEFRASRRQGSSAAQSDKSKQDQTEDKGKGRARNESETPDLDLEEDEEGIPKNPAGDAHRAKGTSLHQRLREARIILHKIKFLQGDVYHVLGKSYENSENEAYAAAEDLRRQLLKGTEEAAEKAMTYLDHDQVVKSLKEEDLYIKVPYLGKGGIKSDHLMEEGDELIEGLLNQQSTLLWEWRKKLIALLTQPLGSSGDGADGQEYSRNLDTQGEAEAYLQAYAALLADRRETLTAERTLLAAHDVREVKARKMNAAQKKRAELRGEIELEEEPIVLDKLDDQEMRPEHQVMAKDLHDARKALLEEFDHGRAIKSIMVDLNNVAVSIQKKDDPEKVLAQAAVAKLRSLIAGQGKLIERLQNDLAHLRRAFNERIAYFRQLQEISDTVAEAEWEGSLADALQELRQQQANLETKINAARARQRYMDNLSKSHEEGTLDEDDKTCILCKCEFVRGYITQCAHVYCEDCMKAWIRRPEGKACPVCRVPLNPDQLQRFTVDNKPGETVKPPPKILGNNEVMPTSRREIQYNIISPDVMQDILAMECHGSYGSKIETLVRHLLYLDVTDSGSKSIIFSAWADSLLIIQHALRANGISCLRIDQNTGRQNAAKKFRTDPTIRVLLLHGERENAGLNVTCASRVFLVESVVHHAFEVQAIARIDRMGQTRPTEVYCYYAEDTVERNILDLAAKQGLSLYTRENASGHLNVTPFAADSDKKQVDAPTKKVQKGDFVYKTEDMLAIFFPHMFEDIEYLLPPDETMAQVSERDGSAASQQWQTEGRATGRGVQENAVAGPSRIQ